MPSGPGRSIRVGSPGADEMISHAQAKLIRRLKRRKRREEEGAFLVEGIRLTEELLASGADVELVVTAPGLEETERGRRLLDRVVGRPLSHAPVSDRELSDLADTETPQGVLAVVRRPEMGPSDLPLGERPVLLILDGVSDPGNLGTLLRVADGLGLTGVVTLPGTVDPWNPKAVRASAGSIFRVPIVEAVWAEVVGWLRGAEVPLLVADPSGEPVRRGASDGGGFGLVLGSEAHGVSREVARDADRRVAIELREPVDSLNVAIAGALLLDRLLAGRRVEEGSGEGA